MIRNYSHEQRKKLFTLAPVILVPLMAFVFDLAGGGVGVDQSEASAGFDTTFPQADGEDIVDSRKLAYEEKDRQELLNNTSASVIDEFDLDNISATVEESTDDIWVDTTPDIKTEADADKEVASLYENFLMNRENRSPSINQNTAAALPAAPSRSPRITPPATEPEIQEQIVKEEEQEPESRPTSLFFDNLNNNTPSNGNNDSEEFETKSIPAVIHGEQRIAKSGSFVKMRITSATEISGITIPANSIVYGLANFGNINRLDISVTSISLKGNPLPINLKAYDVADGRQGILLSGGESGEVKDETIEDAISDASMSGIPGGRLINRAARNLFNKKGDATEIVLISNYKVALKPNQR